MTPPPGHVLVVGDVMRDVLVRPEGPPVRGADRRAEIRFAPGGSGANQAAWLAALGVPTVFVGRVGADDRASLEAEFRTVGVTPRLAADPQAPTGALVVLIDPADGERSFLTARGANDRLCAADLPQTLLDGAALLHVSGYAMVAEGPRAAVSALVAQALARAIPVSVDPGSASFLAEIGAPRFLAAIEGATVLFPNRDEAEALAGAGAAADLARRFTILAIKNGAAPARVYEDGVLVVEAAPPPAAMRDSTGAGDAFAAGFLASWLGGAAPLACLIHAHATAARAIGQLGARPA